MTRMRVVCATILACVSLVLGAWLGGARAALAPSQAAGGTAHYASSRGDVRVGERLEAFGRPMQLTVFSTGDAPLVVARFYARAFAARGIVPIVGAASGTAHVGAFDPDDGRQRFVTAVPLPDGGSLVLAGAVDARTPPRLTGKGDGIVPLPPGARSLLGFRSTDGAGAGDSVQLVAPQPADELLAWYRATLAAQGWQERHDDLRGAGLVTFGRGSEVLSIAVQALAARGGAAAFVTRVTGEIR